LRHGQCCRIQTGASAQGRELARLAIPSLSERPLAHHVTRPAGELTSSVRSSPFCRGAISSRTRP
jgi:hypothetical protein